MSPDDFGWPDEAERTTGGVKFTRRTFMGAVGASGIAPVALGQTQDSSDDVRLDFSYVTDPDTGERVLQVALVTKTESSSASPSSQQVYSDPLILRPASFGPESQFILTGADATTREQTLRIANVSYGRLRGREIRFRFRLADGVMTPDGEPRKRMVVEMYTTVWSSERGPNVVSGFDLLPFSRDGLAASVMTFREFVSGGEFRNNVAARRVSNTAQLMFNGALASRTGAEGSLVTLAYTDSAEWKVACRGRVTGLGQRLRLDDLTISWPRRDASATSAEREAALYCVASISGTEPLDLTLGSSNGASMSIRQVGERRALRLRAQRPQPDDAVQGQAPQRRAEVRTETLLAGTWAVTALRGGRDRTAGPLPHLAGSLLERIDAPDTARANPADRGGTISFQANYAKAGEELAGSGNDVAVTETPLGPLRTRAILDGGGTADPTQDEAFPTRRGWSVTGLWSWGSDQSGTSRNAPRAVYMEAQVALVEAGIALPDAEYSRLTCQDTELRIYYAADPLPAPMLGSYIDLGAERDGRVAELDLSRASLRASQSHHLLSLLFRFSDLSLVFDAGVVRLRRSSSACEISTRPQNGPQDLVPHDTRPTLVVEFPSQHMFEEARFFPGRPPLPDVTLDARLKINRADGKLSAAPEYQPAERTYVETGTDITLDADNRVHVSDALATLRRANNGEASARAFREALQCLKSLSAPDQRGPSNIPNCVPPPEIDALAQQRRVRFARFVRDVTPGLVALRDGPNQLPDAQTVYCGPFALDVDATQVVRTTFDAQLDQEAGRIVDEMFAAVAQTRRDLGLANNAPADFEAALATEFAIQATVPQYQQFRTFYRDQMIALYFGNPSVLPGNARPTSTAPEEVEFLFAAFAKPPPNLATPARISRLAAARAAFVEELKGREDMSGPSRARLAEPSRLAFRINCLDGLEAVRARIEDLDQTEDAVARLPVRDLEFTLETLVNFRGMELSVAARAELVFDPGQLGVIGTRALRIADTTPAAMLRRLNFTIGNEVSVATRLAEIAASLKPPTALQTAIEMPARLTLSPHQNAVVLTPRKVADIFDHTGPDPDTILTGTDAERSASRLWAANFVTEQDGFGLDPGLRAIYSPDLRPAALLARFPIIDGPTSAGDLAETQPPGGPIAPWYLSRLVSESGGATKAEVEADIGPDASCESAPESLPGIIRSFCNLFRAEPRLATEFRSSLDARDRHQLVMLSSAWGLPIVAAQRGDISAPQGEPRDALGLWDIWPGNTVYEPRTLDVTELSLTSLGGNLRHDSSFQPPTAARFWRRRQPVFDAFTVERWQHWINLGRDVFSEVVYKGFLFPLGIRASLVKVTERIFWFDPATRSITAPLRQRMFIRVANPDKLFPAIKQPFQGRRFPVQQLSLLTTTTPDIVDPYADIADLGAETLDERAQHLLLPTGRLRFSGGRGLVFWPRTLKAEQGNIRFEMDVDGVKSDLPLIFADQMAVDHRPTMERLVAYYNTAVASPDKDTPQTVRPSEHIKTLVLHGAERRYAPERKAGSATYQTDHWTLRATGGERGFDLDASLGDGLRSIVLTSTDYAFGPVRQGADQPPFYPAIDIARIHLTQTERLVGRPLAPVRAQFDAHYVLHGFQADEDRDGQEAETGAAGAQSGGLDDPDANLNEVIFFLRDQTALRMGSKGDQSGGVFRPDGYVVALSRLKGAMTKGAQVEFRRESDVDRLHAVSLKFPGDPTFGTVQGAEPAVAAGTALQPAAPPAAADAGGAQLGQTLEELRDIYQSLFSDDAKLLGLISLRQLIGFIEKGNFAPPQQGIPDLAEELQFGAGATADVVRTNVVVPLSAAVRRVRDEWDEIERKIQQAAVGVSDDLGNNVIQIREIFPELYNSLSDLETALSRAEGETDVALFSLELGACYASGQRFLAAVQRAAANPGKAIEEAVTQRYASFLAFFQALDEGVGPFLRSLLLAAVGDLREELVARVAAFVEQHSFSYIGPDGTVNQDALRREVMRRAVIAFPMPASSATAEGWADVADCLDVLLPPKSDVEVALSSAAAHATEAALAAILAGRPLPAPEDLLRGWLQDPAVDIGFAYPQVNLLAPLKDDIKTVSDAMVNAVSDSATKALIGRIWQDLETDLNAAERRLFGSDGAFRSGPPERQLRNRYLWTLIHNLAAQDNLDKLTEILFVPDGDAPDLGFIRDFVGLLGHLLSQIEAPDRPDLTGLLDGLLGLLKPLVDAAKALSQLVRGIETGSLPDILEAVRALFDGFGVPLPALEGDLVAAICKVIDEIWSLARPVLTLAAEAGEETALCPPNWTGPTVAAVNEALRSGTFSGLVQPAGQNETLCEVLLGMGLQAEALRQTVADETQGIRAQFDALQAELNGAADVPMDVVEAVGKAVAGGAQTETCLADLRDESLRSYVGVLNDTAALRQTVRDLRLVAALTPCKEGEIQPDLERLRAFVRLPGDFRALAARREALVQQLDAQLQQIVAKLNTLRTPPATWIPALPLAFGTLDYLRNLGLLDDTGSVPAWVSDEVRPLIEDLQTSLQGTAETVADFLQPVGRLLCDVAGLVERGLDAAVKGLEEIEGQVADAQRRIAEDGPAVPPGLVGILRRVTGQVQVDVLLQEARFAQQRFSQLSLMRTTLCPPENPPALPSINDFPRIGPDGEKVHPFDLMGAHGGAASLISQLADVQQHLLDQLVVIVDELRVVLEQEPRKIASDLFAETVVKVLAEGSASLGDAKGIASLYKLLLEGRNEVYEALDGLLDAVIDRDQFLVSPGPVRRPIPDKYTPVDPESSTGGQQSPGDKMEGDRLAGDAAWLKEIESGQLSGTDQDAAMQAAEFLVEFVQEWAAGGATPFIILRRVAGAIEDIFTGELFRYIDFAKLREEFEEYLLSLVPTRLRMGYGFDIVLGESVASATAGIFRPGPGTALGIDVKIEVDLAGVFREQQTPEVEFLSLGTIGPFDVKLVGDGFDALTLRFGSARFESKSGSKPRFDIVYLGHEIGDKLQFLQDLQSYLAPKDGSGVILRFDQSMPGVEAGYRLQMGDFSVGNLAFTNVGLESTAILPFSEGEAVLKASLSSRASPFTLTYAPYGGSGFFAILANATGIIGFEAGFEFGGSAVFAFGPLSGQGRLMSGVYIRQIRLQGIKITEISMTFFAGGSASIWIFSFSAALSLKMGMVNGNMTGQATFSFSFSMGLCDYNYMIRMEKSESKGFQGDTASLAGPRGIFASLGAISSSSRGSNPSGALIENSTFCQSRSWSRFKSYFSETELPAEYF